MSDSRFDHGLITYRLDLEYDGTDFQGWQSQPDVRTVQDCLEAALAPLFDEKLTVIGSGRTDAGVHAAGQVAHFRTAKERSPRTVGQALNALLPKDIRIHKVTIAGPDFHARFSACWRTYRYRIAHRPLAIGRQYCWNCPHPLDTERMQSAVQYILGNNVFKSFAHAREEEKHYLSSVYQAQWSKSEYYDEFSISANRFLHGMVRFLVGTFVDIGRGKIEPVKMLEILNAQDIRLASPKAPASGLTLQSIHFEPWTPGTFDDESKESALQC
jgi:tRNA pseudouridine38-40 synthase